MVDILNRKVYLFSLSLCVAGIALYVGTLAFLLTCPVTRSEYAFDPRLVSDGTYGGPVSFFVYSEDFGRINIEPDQDGSPRLVFTATKEGTQEYNGFGFESAFPIDPNGVVRIRARFRGEADWLELHLIDTPPTLGGEGEDYVVRLPPPQNDWNEYEIPLRNFARNSYQGETASSDGSMHPPFTSIELLFPPGSSGALEIAELGFHWEQEKLEAMVPSAILLLFGVLLIIRSRSTGARGISDGRGIEAMIRPRLVYALMAAGYFLDLVARGAPPHGIEVRVAGFLFLVLMVAEDFYPVEVTSNSIAAYRLYAPFAALCFISPPLLPGFALTYAAVLIPPLLRHDRAALPVMAILSMAIFAIGPGIGNLYANFDYILAIALTTLVLYLVMENMLLGRADAETRQARTLYDAIRNHSSDLIVTLNDKGLIAGTNRAFETVAGLRANEVEGKAISIFFRIDESGASIVGTNPRRGTVNRFDACLIDGERCLRAVQVTETPLYEGNALKGYLLIATDITDRKRLEQELRQANAQLEDLARIDGLTGIANRRAFDERLKEEWRRAAREEKPLALLMIDVDHFKGFNDTYGHAEGDECLAKVGNVLGSRLRRASDFVARYGGEEFAVILPSASGDIALMIADQLREAVFALAIPHSSSSASDRVTVSIGACSTVPGINVEFAQERLIRAADSALYDAKRTGRNRVSGAPFERP